MQRHVLNEFNLLILNTSGEYENYLNQIVFNFEATSHVNWLYYQGSEARLQISFARIYLAQKFMFPQIENLERKMEVIAIYQEKWAPLHYISLHGKPSMAGILAVGLKEWSCFVATKKPDLTPTLTFGVTFVVHGWVHGENIGGVYV